MCYKDQHDEVWEVCKTQLQRMLCYMGECVIIALRVPKRICSFRLMDKGNFIDIEICVLQRKIDFLTLYAEKFLSAKVSIVPFPFYLNMYLTASSTYSEAIKATFDLSLALFISYCPQGTQRIIYTYLKHRYSTRYLTTGMPAFILYKYLEWI